MKTISVFNNKGGVGKSTLSYHIGNALADLVHKVLLVDLDPQYNLTLCSMMEEELHQVWEQEDNYIDSFEESDLANGILNSPRSIHFLLKPVEDGLSEFEVFLLFLLQKMALKDYWKPGPLQQKYTLLIIGIVLF